MGAEIGRCGLADGETEQTPSAPIENLGMLKALGYSCVRGIVPVHNSKTVTNALDRALVEHLRQPGKNEEMQM